MVVVVAVFRIQEGKVEEAIALFEQIVVPTHDEAGCLSYALHRDTEDPSVLVIVERWTSQVALANHFVQPHMAIMRDRGAEFLAGEPSVHFLDPIAIGDPIKGAL